MTEATLAPSTGRVDGWVLLARLAAAALILLAITALVFELAGGLQRPLMYLAPLVIGAYVLRARIRKGLAPRPSRSAQFVVWAHRAYILAIIWIMSVGASALLATYRSSGLTPSPTARMLLLLSSTMLLLLTLLSRDSSPPARDAQEAAA